MQGGVCCQRALLGRRPGEAAYGRENQVTQMLPSKCWTHALLPLAIPARNATFQKLPNACQIVAGHLPREPTFNPISATICRVGPHLGRVGPKFDQCLMMCPNLGRCWCNLAKTWPTFVRFGTNKPRSVQNRSNLAKVGKRWSNVFQDRRQDVARHDRCCRNWAESRLLDQLLSNCWTSFPQLLENCRTRRDRWG